MSLNKQCKKNTTEMLYISLYWKSMEGLTSHQMESILLTSDSKRKFNKEKEWLEKEKIGKSEEDKKEIDKKILEAKRIFDMVYDYHKTRFYKQ